MPKGKEEEEVRQEDMMPKGKEEEEVKREDMTAKGEGEQEREEEHLCLDAGYTGREAIVKKHGFIPHIRPRGEEKQLIKKNPSYKARRWGVEACHSWFNRFRKLVPRYEKTDESYLALCMLAATQITLNKCMPIYG